MFSCLKLFNLKLEVSSTYVFVKYFLSNHFLILLYSKRTLAWRCQIVSTIWSGTSVNPRQLEYFSCPGLFEYVQFGIHNWNACECWTYVSIRYRTILNLISKWFVKDLNQVTFFTHFFFAKCLYFVFRTVAIYQS